MRDLPGPGIEPMSPALAGGFLAAEPPGKPLKHTAFTVHSTSIIIPSAPPEITRHEIPEDGDPVLDDLQPCPLTYSPGPGLKAPRYVFQS